MKQISMDDFSGADIFDLFSSISQNDKEFYYTSTSREMEAYFYVDTTIKSVIVHSTLSPEDTKSLELPNVGMYVFNYI